jgi:hypothetical protein
MTHNGTINKAMRILIFLTGLVCVHTYLHIWNHMDNSMSPL